MDKPHAAALRRGRFSEQGRIYLLTTVTDGRHPIFAEFRIARLAVAALRESDALELTDTLAYVLMPDHLHWLFALRGGELSGVARRFKSNSGRIINRARGAHEGRLWQPGFHDHAVRREEDVRKLARYVIANPLRAGLVGKVGDYPHWDAVWL